MGLFPSMESGFCVNSLRMSIIMELLKLPPFTFHDLDVNRCIEVAEALSAVRQMLDTLEAAYKNLEEK